MPPDASDFPGGIPAINRPGSGYSQVGIGGFGCSCFLVARIVVIWTDDSACNGQVGIGGFWCSSLH